MRGRYDSQVTMLAFIDLETRVPTDHPVKGGGKVDHVGVSTA